MKKFILLITIAIILAVSTLGWSNIMMRINLFARGAALIDGETGELLFSKHGDRKLYPASTTKVLTALIVVENLDLDDVVVVGDEVKLIADDSSKAGIKVGESYTVKDLLMGLMLVSGNDAANTLAVHTARQINGNGSNMNIDQSIGYFVNLMNERARELGAQNSHFANPHGYHDANHYTTACDMALITKAALSHSIIAEIGSTDRYEVKGLKWTNTNYMVVEGSTGYYEFATGLKTGHTSQAKYCLVTTASKGGRELISVILKSNSKGRWKDARALMDYGFGEKNINTYKLQAIGEIIKEFFTLKLLSNDSYYLLMNPNV